MIIKRQVHNIFSKEKEEIKKEFPKEKVIADYREKNCLVASELVHLGLEVEFKELKVADYIVKDVAIERKTVTDFISSMINKRLLNQIEELQQYENKLLIIEGIDKQEIYSDDNHTRVNANALRGFLLSILLKYKIPIMFTKDSQDTAKFISVLSKKKSKPLSLNAKKKSLDKKEQKQFIVEGFPGIGPTTAKKLLTEFKSIKNLVNASEEKLNEILGKKVKIIKKIIEENYE